MEISQNIPDFQSLQFQFLMESIADDWLENDDMPHIYNGTRLDKYWSVLKQHYRYFNPFQFWELCDFIAFNVYDPDDEDIVEFLVENRYFALVDKLGFGVPVGNTMPEFVAPQSLRERKRRKTRPPTPVPWKQAKIGVEKFHAESEVNIEADDITPTPVEQNVEFLDDQTGTLYDLHASRVDTTYHHSDEAGLNALGGFLERTVPICTVTWNISTDMDEICYPWEEFLKDPAIRRKVDNYYMFRADGLRLHFKINGSPFHYGRAYAAFTPTAEETFSPAGVGPHNGNVAAHNGSQFGQMNMPKCTYSQQPGVFLDPTTNQPQEFIIPFFFPLNYVDLRYDDQLKRLGTLRVFDIVELLHANGGTEPINIQIFASLINPVLTMPYSQTSFAGESDFFVAEAKANGKKGPNNNSGNSGKKKLPPRPKKSSGSSGKAESGNDEYGNGIVSAPASALAKFAGYLESVPVIGPYANATKIGASAVSKIASLFGFSRPVHLDPSGPFRPRPFGLLANTEGEDTIPKLTLDPKQELTVDPATVGLEGTDQMSIAHVAKRESLIAIGRWDSDHSPGTAIMAWKVHPCNFPVGEFESSKVMCPSAIGWVSMPFMHWRGAIEYRIQVVASQMHRGRLAIQWSPTVNNSVPTDVDTWESYLSTSEFFTEVVDLTEGRDYTFSVNYAQPNPWLEVAYDYDDVASVYSNGSFSNMTTRNFHNCNGMVVVRVLTELGAPANGQHVNIAVYARAGNDFMLRNPTNENISDLVYEENYSQVAWNGESDFFVAESAAEADYTASEENVPCQEHVTVLNGASPGYDPDDVSSVFFGEQIVSLRNLIKRYAYLRTDNVSGGNQEYSQDLIRYNSLPPRPGFGSLSSINYPTQNLHAWVQWSHLRYFLHGFAGFRGSMRWKIILSNRDASIFGNNVQVRRDTRLRTTVANTTTGLGSMYLVTREINNLTATGLDTELMYNGMTTNTDPPFMTLSGGEVTVNVVNGGIEFEVPFQSNLRFVYTNETAVNDAATRNAKTAGNVYAFVDWQRHNWEMRTRGWYSGGFENFHVYDIYTAAGEDFSMFFFTCAPMMYEKTGF